MTTNGGSDRGQTRATLKDVARRAGVSVPTASIVLQGGESASKRASEQTRMAIVAAAEELGYVPNQAARGLRVGSPETIALVLRWPGSPWSEGLVTDVSTSAAQRGYSTVVLSTPDWRTYLARGSADAAIIDAATSDGLRSEDLEPFLRRGIQLAVFSDTLAADGFDVIRTNARAAAFEAVTRLVKAGHRRIACLRLGTEAGGSERFSAYLEALHAAGIRVDSSIIRDIGASREISYRESLSLLSAEDRPTAIFAVSDLGAISALWAAQALQIAVPEGLAVIGVGNSREALLTEPQLSSVGPRVQDYRPLATHLLDRIERPDAVEHRTFQENWVVNHRGTARLHHRATPP